MTKYNGIAIAALFAACLWSQPPDPYKPLQKASGKIRIWGHGSRKSDFVGSLVKSWEDGFRKYQPGVDFDTSLLGNASAIGGLYTGAADIALMGREIWPIEAEGYEQGAGHKPFAVSVATGSLDVRNHDFALVVFVHRDNPLSKLTLTQLDAIFGADHRRGPKNIEKWDDLGLNGEWAGKPIHVYGFGIVRDFSQFFEQAVMQGSRKWSCNLQEIPDDSNVDAGQRILDALAKDRYGIALSGLPYKSSLTKPIALAPQDNGSYYNASKENLVQRKYPLTRTVSMFINRVPGQPIDPKVSEFLRYILSREGQDAITRDGGYLPLNTDLIRQELKRLE